MAIAREIEGVERQTMTIKECSEFIGVSGTTLYTMCRLNEISHVRVRGKILFYKPTIIEWLKNGGTNE
ncbi:excisionase family DNA-binding protein [Sporosarcina sp. FA9]|uniref:excisionase family DNA-binding protein n=1 Tax=Sporosarcina sp. FA9 TaxID=3413030 RepID=UPI003F657389